ncbi:hypothetical protein D9602_11685 [Sphingomonas sp. TX0522]|nr:hypothetical protein [Sphingomonas sp. TX0522]
MARLWIQVRKAALPAIVTGILGYCSGLILPPTALYDRLARQDPNDFGGTWQGSAAGAVATLRLKDLPDRKVEGTLEIGGRAIALKGNHDSALVLEGPIDKERVLKIGLDREVGGRFFENGAFVMLVPPTKQDVPPFLVCRRDAMDITKTTDCKSLGPGLTMFSRTREDMD